MKSRVGQRGLAAKGFSPLELQHKALSPLHSLLQSTLTERIEVVVCLFLGGGRERV